MGEEETGQESTTPKKLSIGRRILYFLGMLLYLGISLLLIQLFFKAIDNIEDFGSFAVLFGLCLLGTLTASFLFGYKGLMPVARQAWIKKKLVLTAGGSFLLLIFLSNSFPAYCQYKERQYDSEAKSHLNNLYLGCKAYWGKNGNDKNCNIKITSQKEYGFVQSNRVKVEGHGTKSTFTATAQHEAGTKIFTVDVRGKITDAGGK